MKDINMRLHLLQLLQTNSIQVKELKHGGSKWTHVMVHKNRSLETHEPSERQQRAHPEVTLYPRTDFEMEYVWLNANGVDEIKNDQHKLVVDWLKDCGRRDGLKKWVPVIHDTWGTGTGKHSLAKVAAQIKEGRVTQDFKKIKGPLSMFGRKGHNNTSRGRAAQCILRWHQLKSVEDEQTFLFYFQI